MADVDSSFLVISGRGAQLHLFLAKWDGEDRGVLARYSDVYERANDLILSFQ
jgi:hypothetical protein